MKFFGGENIKLNQISAKTLGMLALKPYCPRCCWIKLKCKLPYQKFPGIFSSIDSYTKKVVHGYMDQHNCPPPWLKEIGGITGYIDPPHYSKFQIPLQEYRILMTGAADLILSLEDGSICIVDYKTSRFSKAQAASIPQYQVQLNGYAMIAERIGLGKVSKLALVYMEPQTKKQDAIDKDNNHDNGFKMDFFANIINVELAPDKFLSPVLKTAQELFVLDRLPKGMTDCNNCELLSEINRVNSNTIL